MERYAKEQQVLRKLEENGWEAWFVGHTMIHFPELLW